MAIEIKYRLCKAKCIDDSARGVPRKKGDWVFGLYVDLDHIVGENQLHPLVITEDNMCCEVDVNSVVFVTYNK